MEHMIAKLLWDTYRIHTGQSVEWKALPSSTRESYIAMAMALDYVFNIEIKCPFVPNVRDEKVVRGDGEVLQVLCPFTSHKD